MSDRPTLTVVDEDGAHADVVHQEHANPAVGDADGRIAELEDQLSEAIALETEMEHHLGDQRRRSTALVEDLRKATEEAANAAVAEADLRRDAILAEAKTMRASATEDAEREAAQITQQAFKKSKSIVAAAEQEAAAILDAQQRELATLEDEVTQRIEALEAQEAELLARVEIAKTIYEELQETLQTVAQASINELASAKIALAKMQPGQSPTPLRRSDDA